MNSQKMEKLITDITDAFVLAMREEAIPPASMARVLATVKDAVVNNVDFPNWQWVVVSGNPFGGIDKVKLRGPFDTRGEAQTWADAMLPSKECWIAELED